MILLWEAPRFADYILLHDGMAIAVVDAKRDHQKCMYVVMFEYSSNGHGIEEFDFNTNKQATALRYDSCIYCMYF